MTTTALDIIEHAEALAGGSVVLHQHVESDVLGVLPAAAVAAVAGMGESTVGVQIVSESTNELAGMLSAALRDEELDDEEKVALGAKVNRLRLEASATAQLASVALERMPRKMRLSEPGAAFETVAVDGMRVVVAQLGHLVELIRDWLDPEEPGGPGSGPSADPDYPSVHPGVDYPEGGDRSMTWAVRRALSGESHECWSDGELADGRATIDVFLPRRSTRGVCLGGSSWSELDVIETQAVGARVLRIFGHPEASYLGRAGTLVRWNGTHSDGGGKPYGDSMRLRHDDGWEGRVHLHDLVIQCSPNNAIGGGQYGSQKKRPMHDVRRYRGGVVDGPHRCVRPISLNQMIYLESGVRDHTPTSFEHRCYGRNMVGYELRGARGDGAGGQTNQWVSRKDEGPQYDRSLNIVDRCAFHDHHRDPSRRGTYETVAGDGHDYLATDSIWWETLEDGRSRGEGLFVVWDGGWKRSHELPSGKSNGLIESTRCVYLIREPRKAPIKLHDCEEARIKGAIILVESEHPRTIDVHDGFPLSFEGCNREPLADRLRWFAEEGIITAAERDHLLSFNWVEPSIRLKDSGEVVGPVSQDYRRDL